MSANILTTTQKAQYEEKVKHILEPFKLSKPIHDLMMLQLVSICKGAFFDGAQAGIELLNKNLSKVRK